MTRRKEPMSIAAVGLLALVGGTSLVLYVLVAQHLAPPATLDRPIIISRNSTSRRPAPSSIGGLAAGGHSNKDQQQVASNAPGFVAPAGHDLIATALFTPSPGPAGAASTPTTGAPSADTTSTTPSAPQGAPSPAPSPSSSPPPPTPTPSSAPPAAPPIAAPIAWKGCGRSQGHRLHLPQGPRASAISALAKGHELHPCKSQGHGGPPEPMNESGSSGEYGHHPHGIGAGDGQQGSKTAGRGADASDRAARKRNRHPVTPDHEKHADHHAPSHVKGDDRPHHPKGHESHRSAKVHSDGQAHDGQGKGQGHDGHRKDHDGHAHGDQAPKAHHKNK